MDFTKITYEEWLEELKKDNSEAYERPPYGWYKRLMRSEESAEIDSDTLIFMQDHFRSKAD